MLSAETSQFCFTLSHEQYYQERKVEDSGKYDNVIQSVWDEVRKKVFESLCAGKL